jgi:hypothetical protein
LSGGQPGGPAVPLSAAMMAVLAAGLIALGIRPRRTVIRRNVLVDGGPWSTNAPAWRR